MHLPSASVLGVAAHFYMVVEGVSFGDIISHAQIFIVVPHRGHFVCSSVCLSVCHALFLLAPHVPRNTSYIIYMDIERKDFYQNR